MKTAEMKLRCSVCKYYRLIGYADGHYSIGCMKASADGKSPVDIVGLESCPRDHVKRHFVPVDERQLLSALGSIYAETSAHEAYIPLYSKLGDAGQSVKNRKTLVGKAIMELGILKVISTTIPGKRGLRFTYRWNLKEFGPPSLDMVRHLNDKMAELSDYRTNDRKNREALACHPDSHRMLIDDGPTSCDLCWMRDLHDCRKRLLEIGIDCKRFNVNSIRHEEASMG